MLWGFCYSSEQPLIFPLMPAGSVNFTLQCLLGSSQLQMEKRKNFGNFASFQVLAHFHFNFCGILELGRKSYWHSVQCTALLITALCISPTIFNNSLMNVSIIINQFGLKLKFVLFKPVHHLEMLSYFSSLVTTMITPPGAFFSIVLAAVPMGTSWGTWVLLTAAYPILEWLIPT